MRVSNISSVNGIQNQHQKQKTQTNPSFKMAVDPIRLKRHFEAMLPRVRKYNKQITDKDVITMRKSLDSFIAFSKGVQSLSVSNVENQIYHKFNIPADFQGDKYLAGIVALALNIFKKLKLELPTAVSKKTLDSGIRASCSPLDRSVSFNSRVDWSNAQTDALAQKFVNHSSTGHFLETPMHEFMHSIHIYNLYKLAKQKQELFDKLNSKMLKDFLHMDFTTKMLVEGAHKIMDVDAAQYINKNVSWYASTKPVEMFAEIGTKMIADSLDTKSILPARHPFVFKDFTEDKQLMGMMNDFWKGNFDKYIRYAK